MMPKTAKIKTDLRGMAIVVIITVATMANWISTAVAMDNDHEEVVLSVVTPFPRNDRLQDGFWVYVENLKKRAPWIHFDYRGGPDAIGPLSQGEALSDGAIDAVPLPTSYYEHLLPIASGMQLTPFTPSQERQYGIREFLNEAHEKELGVHYLGNVTAGIPFQLFLNEPIGKADLSGLTIRASATYVPLIQALGGGVVSMPGGELYTALERGVVDGYGWTSVGITSMSFHEVTTYELLPEFYEDTTSLLINKNVWKQLDKETRKVMTEVMIETENELVSMHTDLVQKERAERLDEGMKVLELHGSERQKFLDTAYNAAWRHKIDANPVVKELRELFKSADTEGEDNST